MPEDEQYSKAAPQPGGEQQHSKAATQTEERTIAAVSVRVPPFWKKNPDLWFHQLEAQFHTSGIKSDITKYYTLVGNLDADILTEVKDVITNPPKKDQYLAVKERLLKAFQESEQQQLKKLISGITTDGRKPSQLLNQMKELAGNNISNDGLKTLWMQQLPSQTQAVLTCSTTQDIGKLAEMADKISEVFTDVAAVAAPASTTSDLQQQVAALQKQVEQLKFHRQRQRKFSSSPSRFRRSGTNQTADTNQRPGMKSNNQQQICWYHRRFGSTARRCQHHCSFAKN